MSFMWLILIFMFLIYAGTGRSIWGGVLFDDGFGSWNWGRHSRRRKTDWEIRKEYLKRNNDVVMVNADDRIDHPDTFLENLIADGKLDEAMTYRDEMEKIADEMGDDNCLRKYAIYGARITRERGETVQQKSRVASEDKIAATSVPLTARDKITPPADNNISITEKEPGVISGSGNSRTPPPFWGKKKDFFLEIQPEVHDENAPKDYTKKSKPDRKDGLDVDIDHDGYEDLISL